MSRYIGNFYICVDVEFRQFMFGFAKDKTYYSLCFGFLTLTAEKFRSGEYKQ